MSWECPRCRHFTADGQKHECINDELTTAQAEIAKWREMYERLDKANAQTMAAMVYNGEQAKSLRAQADALCSAIERIQEHTVQGVIRVENGQPNRLDATSLNNIARAALEAYRASQTGGGE